MAVPKCEVTGAGCVRIFFGSLLVRVQDGSNIEYPASEGRIPRTRPVPRLEHAASLQRKEPELHVRTQRKLANKG